VLGCYWAASLLRARLRSGFFPNKWSLRNGAAGRGGAKLSWLGQHCHVTDMLSMVVRLFLAQNRGLAQRHMRRETSPG